MNITINHLSLTHSESWFFYLYERGSSWVLRLANYSEGEKTIRQRNYRTKARFDGYDLRNNTIKEPPMPVDVIAECKQQLKGMIDKLEVS